MDFRQAALKNRYRLLLSLSHFRKRDGSGPAQTIAELTQNAIQWGYVEKRETPKGSLLETWIKKQESPAWATKAAARMLITTINYRPQDELESQALALALAEALPDHTEEQLYALIPADLQSHVDQRLLAQACASRKGQ